MCRACRDRAQARNPMIIGLPQSMIFEVSRACRAIMPAGVGLGRVCALLDERRDGELPQFQPGHPLGSTAAGCRAGWCLSTWWPRWCTAAGMSGSPARGARPHHPSAAGRMGGAGPGRGALRRTGRAVAGGPAEGRVLTARLSGRRGTTVQVEGHIEARTSDRRPSQGVTRLPLAAAQPSAAQRFVWIRSRLAEGLAQAVRAGPGWRRSVSSSRKATRRMRPLKGPITIQ